MRVKLCVYGHSVTTLLTLLNPRGVTTVSHKYSLTVARHATVLVAVPSTVHYPANYEIKEYYLR
jgi:hydroxymethylpyrimidine/phosphomethylpyrimidine kinase